MIPEKRLLLTPDGVRFQGGGRAQVPPLPMYDPLMSNKRVFVCPMPNEFVRAESMF